MSDPKVTYYRDVFNSAVAFSSHYEIKEVDGIFWEVKATRAEGEEYDLLVESDLDPVSANGFWNEYKRDVDVLQRRFEESGKKTSEEIKGWQVPYVKVLKDLRNIDEEEIKRRRFWQAGNGGLHVISRHPGTDDDPKGHGPVAYFTF